ncbi:MAG: hypothetical protein WA005_14110 [Candidatus Binataceae bacterium]
MKLRKNRGAVAVVIDEIEARVNQGMRRPMDLILKTMWDIGRMKFRPENEAKCAEELREVSAQFQSRLLSDEAVAVLGRWLDALRRSFAEKAIR